MRSKINQIHQGFRVHCGALSESQTKTLGEYRAYRQFQVPRSLINGFEPSNNPCNQGLLGGGRQSRRASKLHGNHKSNKKRRHSVQQSYWGLASTSFTECVCRACCEAPSFGPRGREPSSGKKSFKHLPRTAE